MDERIAEKVIISIHAPPRGGATSDGLTTCSLHRFQSTPPARGATCWRGASAYLCPYFNPRPPRGGRRTQNASFGAFNLFQSTPPARGATISLSIKHSIGLFQSTPPARGATRARIPLHPSFGISIHAPREGGDGKTSSRRMSEKYFNPRPPRGGRHPLLFHPSGRVRNFNPRPPRGGRL